LRYASYIQVKYERDEAQNVSNQRKCGGVSFELASLAFEDEHCLVVPDRIDPETGDWRWHAIGLFRRYRASVLSCSWFMCIERRDMAKKLSESSQPAQLKSMSSEDIRNRKLTDKDRQALARIAANQAAGIESASSLKLIPRLTDEQLAAMVRLRDVRPRKQAVSVRLDKSVITWLRSKGKGHLTLINDILANMMEAEKQALQGR